MRNLEIARIFSRMADILEIRKDNVFKIRAYRRAALNLEGLPRNVEDLTREELLEVPGIGADLAGKVEEFVRTGKVEAYEKLRSETPPGLTDLLSVPGLGPRTALLIHDRLGISSLAELERAAAAHRLAGLPGMGSKSEENVLRGIASLRGSSDRRALGTVLPLAEDLAAALRAGAPVGRLEIAGSLRRRKETVKDIDLVATARDPAAVMDVFVRLPAAAAVTMHGPTRSSIVTREGLNVDLRVVEGQAFGAALAYLTGSKGHNIRLREMAQRRGLKLNEYGVFRERDGKRLGGAEEAEVYRLLELPFIPPELREDAGEIEAALAGRLPELVRPEDIRGDLHVHSDWSDGSHAPEELAEAAKRRGLSYLALTDHSRGLGVARGLDPERLREQGRKLAELNRKLKGFTLLRGTEVDIRSDGTLDFPDDVLAELDVVVASIHSGFRQKKERITERIVAAMRNPRVDIIAHPTGRLIGEREPYQVDMEEVLRAAAETGTAMEINAYPLRLDLGDAHARRARELGVKLVICTDLHVLTQFDTLELGVSTARRGWLEARDVLNTLPLGRLRAALKRRRKGP